MKKGFIALLVSLTISCESEENGKILIEGTAQYKDSNLPAENVTIKLTLHDSFSSFKVKPSNIFSTEETITDANGHYSFNIERSELPGDVKYNLSSSADSLVITDELSPGCLPVGIYAGGFSTNSIITKDLKIDFAAFLQIAFNKLDHSTTDRVRLIQSPCVLLESTVENPDTTIIETRHYYYSKIVDVQYDIVYENGGSTLFTIPGVVLSKNDTTKLTIEY